MLTRREASTPRPSPRCTCLPPRQHCVEVALGGKQVHLGFASEYLLSSSCNFNSSPPRPRPSSPRLRLGELGLGLGGLERSQWVGTSCNFSSSPPRQVQVHLGCASVDLALTRGTWAESAKSTSPHSRTKKQNTDRILLQLTILFFWGRILLLWTAVTNSCVVNFQEPLDERNNWKAELVVLTWLWCFWGRLSEIGLLSDYLQTAGGAQQLLNYHVVAFITNEHYNQYYHLHQMTLNI